MPSKRMRDAEPPTSSYTQSIRAQAMIRHPHGSRPIFRRTTKRYLPPPRPYLLEMPIDILLLILDLLDDSDRACLACCSRDLFSTIGVNRLGDVQTSHGRDSPARYEFLVRFSRDIPKSVMCFDCSLVHRMKSIWGPGGFMLGAPLRNAAGCVRRMDALSRPAGRRIPIPITFRVPAEYSITFQHVHIVMAMYRSGLNRQHDHACLEWTEVRRSDEQGVSALISVMPKIISDQLCLRVKRYVAYDDKCFDSASYGIRRDTPYPCIHYAIDPEGMEFLEDQLDNIECSEETCRTCAYHAYCELCHAEYEHRMLAPSVDEGIMLVTTTWLRLGGGMTPLDPDWLCHLPAEESSRPSGSWPTGRTIS